MKPSKSGLFSVAIFVTEAVIFFNVALVACAPQSTFNPSPATPTKSQQLSFPTPEIAFTPLPTRPPFGPGELVDYLAQTGDTLPALASHFNTSVAEIMAANPIIPQTASSMPPGMPMKIPIYNRPLWGSPYQIIPDSLFVNGPAQADFDVEAFINSQPGWLKSYRAQLTDGNYSGAEIITLVAKNFSVSPRLQLALLEYFGQALSNPIQPETKYIFGYKDQFHPEVYLQLVWMANTLNNGYYGWRRGSLIEFDQPNGRIERPDPWQNAATVAIQYAFSRIYSTPTYDQMIGPGGLAETYLKLFGDPWANVQPHIPGSLNQPAFILPFEPGRGWNFTGGPHTGWGKGEPLAAIDFAPNGIQNCNGTNDWATAVADGVIARSDYGEILLDLDGDGKEQTGWVVFYLHMATDGRIPLGSKVSAGDRLGHPSCEGGESSGTHLHMARKYNGEWMLADSPIPYNLEGWIVHNGDSVYQGTMLRFSQIVIASDQAEGKSYIKSDR
jgi:murein DD-endopeptidase MepM/ murein hydrolase activator NlpD